MRIRTFKLDVVGSPKPFIVDLRLLRKLSRFTWRFIPGKGYAKATVYRGRKRILLHHYIAKLNGKRWNEIFFDNEDKFDCRMVNLRPYQRSADGRKRRNFKNKSVPYKGVYLRTSGKFGAIIRHNRRLRYLGTFSTAEEAANAYNAEVDKISAIK